MLDSVAAKRALAFASIHANSIDLPLTKEARHRWCPAANPKERFDGRAAEASRSRRGPPAGFILVKSERAPRRFY
jgi:hypothetical protein